MSAASYKTSRVCLLVGREACLDAICIVFADLPMQMGQPRTFRCVWHNPPHDMQSRHFSAETMWIFSLREASAAEAAPTIIALHQQGFTGTVVSKKEMRTIMREEYPRLI